ncbi:tectonic-like complex member MKS1 [Oncorhynchus masou masou]|uniref:tectonic-like complex member MKS1 n=1 Tax=Oncorhynchus masou masou TaxID=90313 RepID=UPI0031840678
MVTQVKSNPTLLAHRMVNVRHRRQDRRLVDRTIPKSRLITWEPSEDFVKTSHMVNTPVQTMHIMGDLGPAGKLGQKEKECLSA